jgi:acetyltransferase-like isoleucine patch superfamily enzyme/2-polyprenyl-3-methyl-5-hydroxy-6-metoxy-1,4-benzoquinol methylase
VYGRRAALNLVHPDSEYTAVTEMQKDELFPLLNAWIGETDKVVLDLGCGPGRFTPDLAGMVKGKAIGVDVVPAFLRLAPKQKNVEYRVMRKSTAIPMPDSSVDVVWICLVLGGLSEKIIKNLVKEIDRVLKHNGLLFIAENTTKKKSADYWMFRTVDQYRGFFPFVNLEHLNDYRDADERISVMAGRRYSHSSHSRHEGHAILCELPSEPSDTRLSKHVRTMDSQKPPKAMFPTIIIHKFLHKPRFSTNDVKVGRNVYFGKHVTFDCKRVRIGDCTRILDSVTVTSNVFEIGDYGTVYDRCFFPGPGEIRIGHNFWLGTGSIVDGRGGTTIGNNVGIGAQSQLWTHMIFGDVMYGCRFHSTKPLTIHDDAWIVGRCSVSPVTIGARSLILPGCVITKDVKPDMVYAGIPGRNVTEKFGSQFRVTSTEERVEYLEKRIEEFGREKNIRNIHDLFVVVGDSPSADSYPNSTIFNVGDRTYAKRGTLIEQDLMRFLLPDAKFVPTEKFPVE